MNKIQFNIFLPQVLKPRSHGYMHIFISDQSEKWNIAKGSTRTAVPHLMPRHADSQEKSLETFCHTTWLTDRAVLTRAPRCSLWLRIRMWSLDHVCMYQWFFDEKSNAYTNIIVLVINESKKKIHAFWIATDVNIIKRIKFSSRGNIFFLV
jgi:hypothetical protein